MTPGGGGLARASLRMSVSTGRAATSRPRLRTAQTTPQGGSAWKWLLRQTRGLWPRWSCPIDARPSPSIHATCIPAIRRERWGKRATFDSPTTRRSTYQGESSDSREGKVAPETTPACVCFLTLGGGVFVSPCPRPAKTRDALPQDCFSSPRDSLKTVLGDPSPVSAAITPKCAAAPRRSRCSWFSSRCFSRTGACRQQRQMPRPVSITAKTGTALV